MGSIPATSVGPLFKALDVRDFPFDRQTFEIRIASSTFSLDEVVLVPHEERSSGVARSLSLPDWQILDSRLEPGVFQPAEFAIRLSSVALMFTARRYVSPYMVKVIIPLILIVCMSAIVFWIDPSQSGTQIGVATSSMLTLIAYRFMVGNDLPPVPYLTRMDAFILGSTILVFVALIQAVVTSVLVYRGKAERAERLDRTFRWLFPVVFGILLVGSLSL